MGLLLAATGCTGQPVVGLVSPPQPPLDEPIGLHTQEPTALDARLAVLDERLRAAMKEHHVPGLALAVVKDNEVVFAKGYGMADLDEEEPVTPQTLFAIGSSTKAFTAALVGTLVEDGKMGWDDPIARHVPEFDLKVDGADEKAEATIRDALSHRTGFTRMSLAWISGTVPRPEVLATAAKAKAWAKHREKFLYNNVTYTAAGEASARVAGSSWDELLRRRLLGPLGMTETTSDYDAVDDDERRAQGYVYKEAGDRFEPVPMRSLDEIAPAGGITSNVLDMSRWIRMLLDDGELDGARIVPASVLDEAWSPQMKISGSMQYGLGWFIETWQGKKVVHHGGNIDGYAAQVGLMPGEDLGFVMLTNVSHTPLQRAVLDIVWDSLLGEPATAGTSEDLSPYVGTYIADFGPFDQTPFKVTDQGGKLYVDVPGQMNYELRAPGEDGRRVFAVTGEIAVSFEGAEDGEAEVMRMHQGGLDFEVFREGYVPDPEVPLAELERYLGRYESKELGVAEVLVQHNRLAVDIPKQMAYELHPPDDEGKWRFRVKDGIAIAFVGNENKPPKTMELHQDGETVTFTRLSGTAAKLPTLAELERLRRPQQIEAKLQKLGVLRGTGTVAIEQSGVEGKTEITIDPKGRTMTAIDFGKFGNTTTVVLPDRAWRTASFAPLDQMEGDLLLQAQLGDPLTFLRDWEKSFGEIRVTGTTELDGRDAVVVQMDAGELPPYKVTVDAETGDVLQVHHLTKLEHGALLPTTTRFEDYRRVGGVRMPFRMVTRNDPEGQIVVELDSMEPLPENASDPFPRKPPEKD